MGKLLRKFKRFSLYKKSLLFFCLLMVAIGFLFLSYVYSSMVIYERNLVDNYIEYIVKTNEIVENIPNDLFVVSHYEKNNKGIKNGIKKIFKNEDLKYKKNSQLSKNDVVCYDIFNNNSLIATISLKKDKTYQKMAILTINEWVIEDIKYYFDEGIYNYEINVPNNHKVYINDILVKESDMIGENDVLGLDRLTQYVEINKTKTYKITGLINKPEIIIKDENNKEIKYKIDKNTIYIEEQFQYIKDYEHAKEYIKDDFDLLELAENWSLFLTDDLKGSYHGFFKLTPYLIEGSYMYDMAYGWSHNVDITFVSKHSLKNPIFTNEKVENFIIYNDQAFSCEVYLEKNMVVSGKDKKDIMHDRLYFVYYDNGYKLVNMESI